MLNLKEKCPLDCEGLSISFEVAGYFQKVGGEVVARLCPNIFSARGLGAT
jgi:hypothetical protein